MKCRFERAHGAWEVQDLVLRGAALGCLGGSITSKKKREGAERKESLDNYKSIVNGNEAENERNLDIHL